MRHVGRWTAGAAGLYALLCGCRPGFARAALDGFARPAMSGLHRLTAAAPFPVVEPLFIATAAATLMALVGGRAARRRAGRMIIALVSILVLLWAPAMAQPVEAPPTPSARQLERLCDRLIVALNQSNLDIGDDALRRAGAVAGMPGCVVKAARYPEWMRATRCAGLFMPLTGEALVDAGAPAALVPFTAVHELMHLNGVADEGAANALAWEMCVRTGGDFAASARLWALRYAMGLLRAADAAAFHRAEMKMEAALSRAFLASGGGIAPASPATFSLARGDYAAFVRALAAGL